MNYNYFPMGYQPMYQQPQQSGGANAPIWVQGESAAKAWFVPPNNTVALWDSESQTIYLKSADASGMPSLRIFDYTERTTSQEPKTKDLSAFALKDDLDNLATKDELKKAISELEKKLKGKKKDE